MHIYLFIAQKKYETLISMWLGKWNCSVKIIVKYTENVNGLLILKH